MEPAVRFEDAATKIALPVRLTSRAGLGKTASQCVLGRLLSAAKEFTLTQFGSQR